MVCAYVCMSRFQWRMWWAPSAAPCCVWCGTSRSSGWRSRLWVWALPGDGEIELNALICVFVCFTYLCCIYMRYPMSFTLHIVYASSPIYHTDYISIYNNACTFPYTFMNVICSIEIMNAYCKDRRAFGKPINSYGQVRAYWHTYCTEYTILYIPSLL